MISTQWFFLLSWQQRMWMLGSFYIYRPFCQLICPFGLISWLSEHFSLFRVVIDKNKCNRGGACISVCPLESAKGLVYGNNLPQDCFSCGRCLKVCPEDAIQYKSIFRTKPKHG